jgi:NAD(P)-dependent dehydrogenase (short-subunit alcohol dehydrogenase family)
MRRIVDAVSVVVVLGHRRSGAILTHRMDANLTGKVALVTGGGSGIGEGACHALARAGAAVAVVDVREQPARAVAEHIQAVGGRALAAVADVGDERLISAAIARAVDTFGGLHVVFANAGINGMQCPIEEMTVDEWYATINTNLTGTFLTVKHSIPQLRAAGGGSIIVTSSINGSRLFGLPGYACYSTSKAGQVAFTKMAAIELARWGIRVNVILPGGVRTNIRERTYRRNLEPITYGIRMPASWPPLHGRPAAPDEIANLIVFLASDESSYITGAEIVIDAAASLLRG